MSNENSKILVVDDEPDILNILSYNLKKEGYTVEVANNGAEALTVCDEFNPDLIILDIMMPEMDGIEVCKELRKKQKFTNTIIAFLTARNEDFTQILALDNGGDDFITKPIKPNVLKSRISALLRRKKPDSGLINKFGDLTLDHNKYCVYLNDEEIQLAKKEFELLALLTSQPGKVFKRHKIMDKVWGDEVIVGDRTIDVHVRKIREKIGSHYIKTLKGIGYKFDF